MCWKAWACGGEGFLLCHTPLFFLFGGVWKVGCVVRVLSVPRHGRRGSVVRSDGGRWRVKWLPLLAAGVAVVGMLVVVYPSAAAWVSQYNQSKVVVQSRDGLAALTAAQQRKALRAAERYNGALSAGARYKAESNVPTSSAGVGMHEQYLGLLNADRSGMIGRLQVPSIGLDLPIYHGTSDATLLRGIGHLEGTSLPVGGKGTHAVLTGHRGLASATMFTYLNEVKVGDRFTVSVFGRVLSYRVVDTKVVDPDQTQSLKPVVGKDLVTLVTCTPLGINTQRIFVTGERVIPTPVSAVAAANKNPSIPGFPWWVVVVGVGLIAAGVYVWRSGYPQQKKQHTHKAHRAA